MLGQVPGLDEVLVAGSGFTLYLFVPDKRSGTSTCYGPCAEAWPPFDLPTGVTRPVAGAGVNVSLRTTTKRNDGTTELVYTGWPLCRRLHARSGDRPGHQQQRRALVCAERRRPGHHDEALSSASRTMPESMPGNTKPWNGATEYQ